MSNVELDIQEVDLTNAVDSKNVEKDAKKKKAAEKKEEG